MLELMELLLPSLQQSINLAHLRLQPLLAHDLQAQYQYHKTITYELE